ncbi:Rho termination factor N-terminal domain-containing protein, partial [Amycolatopsis magusensis]
MSNTDLLSGDAATGESSAEPQANGTAAPKRRPGGLSGMVIADLRSLAGELGISDTAGMRKGDLIAAIRERQGKTKRRTSAAATATTADTLPLDGIEGSKPAETKARAPRKEAEKAEKPVEQPKAEAQPEQQAPPAAKAPAAEPQQAERKESES